MKPKELLADLDMKKDVYASDKKILEKYFEDDCIIAYDLNKLGSIFIIRGKLTYFCFVCMSDIFKMYQFFSRRINLITFTQAVKLLGDNCIILNKQEYSRLKKKVILENL